MLSAYPVILTLWASLAATPTAPTLWTAPPTSRIMPKTPPTEWSAELTAAQNEWEPFQIVLTAGEQAVNDVHARFDTQWRPTDGGRLFPAEQVFLYREHFIHIKTPSPRSDAKPGWYPDALIPMAPERTGYPLLPTAKYRGQGFSVPKGQNQPIWVDLYVPKGMSAGTYEGTILVEGRLAQGKPFRRRAHFKLRVRRFALPERPTCKSSFGSLSRAAKWHDVAEGEETTALIRRYEEALIAHRVMPTGFAEALPRANPDGSIDATQSHPILKHYVNDLHINCFALNAFPYGGLSDANRELTKTYLRNLYSYLVENGWEDMHYIYVFDEPNDANAYEKVRQRAALIHEANPNLKVMCTEQTVPQNPDWGDLYGAVDIWCPLWPLHDPKTAAERLAAGEELWSYTALCQGEKPTPWWQTDFPLLNYRIPLWMNWRSRMTGLLYWSTVYWDVDDPWRDPATCYKKYNGEGSLFYPGEDAGVQGPVASMRLKMVREGMEDYEYLHMLTKLRGQEFADGFVSKVCKDWFTWEKDPAVLYEVRDEIADAIEEAM